MPGIPTTVPYPLPCEDDLPPSIAGWVPLPERAVLLVHDMQRYFLRPLAPDRDPRAGLIANAARLRAACAESGVRVAYTAQPGMTDRDRGLLRDFWGPGMSTSQADRKIVDELAPEPGDWLFTKWRYSAFFRSELLERMRAEDRDQLLLCGIYAHVGILITAVEAFTHDIETFLVADAVADFDAASHRMALDYAAARCAVVTTTGAATAALSGRATPEPAGGAR